jgi:type II secretory pathway component PulM
VSGIDNWYLNYAHRHELATGFSTDDDIPDPFTLEETPGREWTVPHRRGRPRSGKQSQRAGELRALPPAVRGGSWRTAARKWLTEFPQGTNRECLRALRAAGHTDASSKLIERIRASMPKPVPTRASTKASTKAAINPASTASGCRRSRSVAKRESWHAHALQWLREHPGASNRQWLEAIEEAGHVGVTAAAVSALRAQAGPARRKQRPTTVAATTRTPAPVIQARYCEGCGLAVNNDGLCRC